MTRQEQHRRRKNRSKRAGVYFYIRVLALFVLCAAPLFLLKATAAPSRTVEVGVSVKDSEILQGEPLPAFEAEIDFEGRTDIVLDSDKEYTVEDMIGELRRTVFYTMQCESDGQTEGEFAVNIALDDAAWRTLDKKYGGRINLNLHPGTLKVKNPVGEWEDSRFKRYDGSYVMSDFVVSMGKTYYFDAEGNMVTGWQDINGGKYCFDDKGVMLTSCWQDNGESKSYLDESGRAVMGWLDLEDKRYFFDGNCLMATGEMVVGFTKYTFGKDGAMKSEEVIGIDPSRPMVALTFDDGPGERTGELLAQLEQYHAHATFFMVGKNVPSHADFVKKMLEIGCELGNHSYDHANLGKASAATIQKQVGDTNNLIASAAGQGATVMRPPYGSISQTLRSSVGMPMILWNIDTLDWKTRNAQSTIDTVMNNVGDGDVILMHDIHTQTIDAALQLIPMLQAKGFQLVTVSELASAKGVQLQNGEKYTDFTE